MLCTMNARFTTAQALHGNFSVVKSGCYINVTIHSSFNGP